MRRASGDVWMECVCVCTGMCVVQGRMVFGIWGVIVLQIVDSGRGNIWVCVHPTTVSEWVASR